MKIIIIDAEYKHSLALAKYIKKYDESIKIIGFIRGKPKNYFVYKILYKKYSNVIFGDLKTLLNKDDYSLVIPIGGDSVRIVAQHKTKKNEELDNLQINEVLRKVLKDAEIYTKYEFKKCKDFIHLSRAKLLIWRLKNEFK